MQRHEIILAFVDIKGSKTCIAGQVESSTPGAHRITFGVLPPYTPDRLPPKGSSKLGLPPSIVAELERIEQHRIFPTLRTGMDLDQWRETTGTGIREMMQEISARRPFFAAPCNELLLFSIAFRLAESGLMMPNLFSVTIFPDKEDFDIDAEREMEALIEESTSRVLSAVALVKNLVKMCAA